LIPIERDHAVRSKAATCSDEGGRVSLPAFGVGSDFLGCVKFGALRSDLSHAVSIECEAVSVMDEAVEDGVGDGRITVHCRAPQSSIGWCPMSRLLTRGIPSIVIHTAPQLMKFD
jgi:hypothetical protein